MAVRPSGPVSAFGFCPSAMKLVPEKAQTEIPGSGLPPLNPLAVGGLLIATS